MFFGLELGYDCVFIGWDCIGFLDVGSGAFGHGEGDGLFGRGEVIEFVRGVG